MHSKELYILALLWLASLAYSMDTQGGNVTNVGLTVGNINTSRWDGIYGDVVLGTAANYTYTVTGNNVALINVVAASPPCAYTSISVHIIAFNASTLALPLSAGNLTKLDLFVGNGTQNASATFANISTFVLSMGTYAEVPTTYTYANNLTSTDFSMGYFNDAVGNLVFVANVASDRPNWNGSTSDYQIMLPNNGSATEYNITSDVVYTCPGPGPGPGRDNVHRLYVYPIDKIQVKSGVTFNLPVTVKNTGDYTEHNINVYISTCPSGFSCGSTSISQLVKGQGSNVTLPITAGNSGEYVMKVCAASAGATNCRDFIVKVLPECATDADCKIADYCDSGVCKPKKPEKEKCVGGNQCQSGICAAGVCVRCTSSGDCATDEMCSSGSCIKVPCACGVVVSHTCIAYECCEDSQCGRDEFCIAKKCEEKEIALLVIKGIPIEGKDVLVRVENNKGQPIPSAIVTTNDGQMLTVDENGYTTVRVPYDGLLHASASGYPQTGLLLDVIRIGLFVTEKSVYVGVPTKVRLVDSKRKPIAGADVTADGKIYKTDANGEVWITFDSEGKKALAGEKKNYLVSDAEITVLAGERPACGFPILLNIFWFPPPDVWALWVFAALLALANIAIYTRRKRKGRELKALVYFLTPLLLAVPDTYIFTICFMINVVVLQFIIELIVIINSKLLHHHKKKTA